MSPITNSVLPATFSAVETIALKRYVDRVSERSFRFSEPEVKSRFHRESRMILRVIARRLDLTVGSYAIRSNMGTLGEPGCITMQLATGSIQIQQSSKYCDIQIRIRRYGGRDNRMLLSSDTLPIATLLDIDCLINRIKPVLDL